MDWYPSDALCIQERKLRDDVVTATEAHARSRGWELAVGESLPGEGGTRRAGADCAAQTSLPHGARGGDDDDYDDTRVEGWLARRRYRAEVAEEGGRRQQQTPAKDDPQVATE